MIEILFNSLLSVLLILPAVVFVTARAGKARLLPVQMLFPLFAFVFPSTFLMIIGPLYFQLQTSGVAGAF